MFRDEFLEHVRPGPLPLPSRPLAEEPRPCLSARAPYSGNGPARAAAGPGGCHRHGAVCGHGGTSRHRNPGRPPGDGPEGRAAYIRGRADRDLHTALLLPPPDEAGGHVPGLLGGGERATGLQPAARLLPARGRGLGGPDRQPQGEEGPGGSARVPAHQPPPRLPGVRPGGECPLQDQTMSYGPGETRFVEEKRHWDKPIAISPLVLSDRERCIQCARCTASPPRWPATPASISSPAPTRSRSPSTRANRSGPISAATWCRSARWGRCWPSPTASGAALGPGAGGDDLHPVRGGLPDGCPVQHGRLVRFLGVDSDPVNWGWLCDKGRFGFEAVNSPQRLGHPLVRRDGELGRRAGPTPWRRWPTGCGAYRASASG